MYLSVCLSIVGDMHASSCSQAAVAAAAAAAAAQTCKIDEMELHFITLPCMMFPFSYFLPSLDLLMFVTCRQLLDVMEL